MSTISELGAFRRWSFVNCHLDEGCAWARRWKEPEVDRWARTLRRPHRPLRHLRTGRPADMLELLRSAVSGHAEVLPGSAACRTGRGVVVKLLGRTPKAVQAALKVLHSLTIAGLSAAAALVIGTTELAGLTAQKLRAHGTFWRRLERININPPALTIGGMFLAV